MFNDKESFIDSLSTTTATPTNHNHQNEHNINVVIRVRPIITRPQTTSSNFNNNNNNNNNNDNNNNISRNKLISQRTETTTTTKTIQKQQNVDIKQQQTAITFPAAGQIQVDDTIANVQRSFSFNVVFEPEASQEQVFEHSGVKRLIDMALDGFACTVFAYGQTSTGKTYTLTGNALRFTGNNNSTQQNDFTNNNGRKSSSKIMKNHHYHQHDIDVVDLDNDNSNLYQNNEKSSTSIKNSNIGIIQLSFAYLFEQIKRRKNRDQTLFYIITVSYLEVYNEQVLDLLNPSTRPLNVRWSKDRGFYAENLFKIECEDLGDLEGVLEEGCKNRQVRSHSMNENSSRSHSVMTINLFSEIADPDDPQGFIRKEGRLCLVDLAGSEKTKRTNSKGGTFIEANNINRSLLVLGNCIACLADPKRRTGHIPYRDSTLTKLLADSLSGNGMTLMIACVSSLKCDSQETISTLRYASRAKRVRMNPVVQMDPRELLILSLKREVRMLRMENQYLRQNYHQLWNSSSNGGDILDNNNLQHEQQPRQATTTIKKLVKNDSKNNLLINEPNINNDNGNENELLNKYMKENEVLRVENVQINLQRNRLIRDHELVCRENEQLLRKMKILLYKLNLMEKNDHVDTSDNQLQSLLEENKSFIIKPKEQQQISTTTTTTTKSASINKELNNNNLTKNLYTSSSSPSLISIYNDDDEDNISPNQENNLDDVQDADENDEDEVDNVSDNVLDDETIILNQHQPQQKHQIKNKQNRIQNHQNQNEKLLDLTVHGRSNILQSKSSSSSSLSSHQLIMKRRH